MAGLADAMHFQGLRLGAETEAMRLLLDQMRDRSLVAYLGGSVAHIADQEWHLVRFGRMLAEHEGIDRFELVDEAILEQEVEGTVDGRRRRAGVAVAQGFRARS
jgi:hypothetical protein